MAITVTQLGVIPGYEGFSDGVTAVRIEHDGTDNWATVYTPSANNGVYVVDLKGLVGQACNLSIGFGGTPTVWQVLPLQAGHGFFDKITEEGYLYRGGNGDAFKVKVSVAVDWVFHVWEGRRWRRKLI